MYPILFSAGAFHIYSLSVALIVAWSVFSFFFWRALRGQGVEEEHIFNLTFYSTVMAFIFSRLVYVLLNFDLFRASMLKIVALWVQPGFSLYGAFLGGLLTLIYLSRQYKVRLGHVLDAFGPAFGAAFIIGAVGSLLDGSYVGTMTQVPWSVRFVGHVGARHPVQLYEILVVSFILIFLAFLAARGAQKKWPYGLMGLWFFALYSPGMFILEFFKDTRVYFNLLRANQWILIAIFAETIGAFYVRGGGREAVRPFINRFVGGIHAKFSKRSA
jgi:prolipoprotein diacylglyceryltransferase